MLFYLPTTTRVFELKVALLDFSSGESWYFFLNAQKLLLACFLTCLIFIIIVILFK